MNIVKLLFLMFAMINLNAQDLSLFEKELFVNKNDTLNYRILKPLNFDSNKKYPVHLFLHGAGEVGDDNELQLTHGADLFLKKENRTNYNSWVIFPQCAKNDYWANMVYVPENNESLVQMKKKNTVNPSLGLVIQLMDTFIEQNNVDKNRIYVSGLSMGGMGTFEILHRRPEMFAAATPICGDGIEEYAKIYAKKVPLWIFHGSDDTVVSPKYSLKMAKAVIEAGGSPKITFYENVGHDSWNNAFEEKDFLKWIHSKSKTK